MTYHLTPPLRPRLNAFMAKWRNLLADVLIADVRHPYRPELHYMRGPGPKWRAKHQSSPQSCPS